MTKTKAEKFAGLLGLDLRDYKDHRCLCIDDKEYVIKYWDTINLYGKARVEGEDGFWNFAKTKKEPGWYVDLRITVSKEELASPPRLDGYEITDVDLAKSTIRYVKICSPDNVSQNNSLRSWMKEIEPESGSFWDEDMQDLILGRKVQLIGNQ